MSTCFLEIVKETDDFPDLSLLIPVKLKPVAGIRGVAEALLVAGHEARAQQPGSQALGEAFDRRP